VKAQESFCARRATECSSDVPRGISVPKLGCLSRSASSDVSLLQRNPVMPEDSVLRRYGSAGVLVFINEAISHLVGPIDRLPKLIPPLERIADALETSRALRTKPAVVSCSDPLTLDMFIDRCPLALCVVRRDYSFAWANRKYRRLFHIYARQVPSVRLIDLLDKKDRQRILLATECLFSGKRESFGCIARGRTVTGQLLITHSVAWALPRRVKPEFVAFVSRVDD